MPVALKGHLKSWGKISAYNLSKEAKTRPVLQIAQQLLWIYFGPDWDRGFGYFYIHFPE